MYFLYIRLIGTRISVFIACSVEVILVSDHTLMYSTPITHPVTHASFFVLLRSKPFACTQSVSRGAHKNPHKEHARTFCDFQCIPSRLNAREANSLFCGVCSFVFFIRTGTGLL
ncbi:hypothetical protein CSKR_203439 [Clonorchis sinensis]|uniref:Uncharacterized protein n=1 Tax=Clonorchis sinensis TaxID=79923 RepID=A0A8T1MAZ4_CLOSI|nr:hypothetical protein CSKR_203439 [Clonorchis sinensis]